MNQFHVIPIKAGHKYLRFIQDITWKKQPCRAVKGIIYLTVDMIINKRIQIIILFVGLLLPVFASAQSIEYTVKAVFLERFTRFIEWPEESAMADSSQPFVLGVIGESPFGSILEEIYSTQKIRDKKVEIRYISKLNEITGCHLLFLSESEKKELPKILSFTRDKPILTIGDTKGFADKGVLINFFFSKDKIRFEINESVVRDSGLKMSYLLLQLAKIVKPIEEKY